VSARPFAEWPRAPPARPPAGRGPPTSRRSVPRRRVEQSRRGGHRSRPERNRPYGCRRSYPERRNGTLQNRRLSAKTSSTRHDDCPVRGMFACRSDGSLNPEEDARRNASTPLGAPATIPSRRARSCQSESSHSGISLGCYARRLSGMRPTTKRRGQPCLSSQVGRACAPHAG
jgi:hypothetical protein